MTSGSLLLFPFVWLFGLFFFASVLALVFVSLRLGSFLVVLFRVVSFCLVLYDPVFASNMFSDVLKI